MSHSSSTGALVIGGDYQGLGIVRSLGRAGVPTCVLDDEPSIATYSRYTSHAVRARNLRDAEGIVESILDAGRRHGLDGWVIFATRDEVVETIARNREALGARFRVATPPWEIVRHAIDKRLTYSAAAEAGVSVPKTWSCGSVEELEAIEPDRWPLVIKPAIKQHFIYETRVKGWIVHDRDELRLRFGEAAAIVGFDEVLIQEMIPGGGEDQYAYCAFFKDGAAVGKMTARRRRQYPPDLGRSSTYVETVDIPELAERSERLLARIGYYGLVELEYKRDIDGSYRLLDVNARTWGYHSLGRRAGVDFPLLLFRDQLGLPIAPAVGRPDVRWVRMLTDAPTALKEIARRNLTVGEYLRSLLHVSTEAVFAWDDLRPGCAELALLPHLIRTRT